MTTTINNASKAQLRDWLDDTTGELASSIAQCKSLKYELLAARKALREVIAIFPRAYPEPCEFHATIDVTSEQLARWKKAANCKAKGRAGK